MMLTCRGANGEEGVCWSDQDGALECHTIPAGLEGDELVKAKADAVRAVMRDGAAKVGGGDPRMMRDG